MVQSIDCDDVQIGENYELFKDGIKVFSVPMKDLYGVTEVE